MTSGGVGLIPFAPGTWGSLVGVGLALLAGDAQTVFLLLVMASFAGFVLIRPAQAHFGVKDPQSFVIDETAGQLLTLVFLPLTWPIVVAGFVLFRLLDIFKPLGIRRIDQWSHPAGVVLDDLAAGVLANLALQILVRWSPAFWIR